MRLFTAIELPAAVCETLAGAQAELKREITGKVSWTGPRNLHLTLKFLGEVPDSDVPALCNALGKITSPRMSLAISHLSQLPPNGAARVLMAGVEDSDQSLAKLFGAIEYTVEPLGFAREKRKFRPHITLGRMRMPRRVSRELERVKLEPTRPFEVKEFVLMQSVLSNVGSQYTRVMTVHLG